MHPRAGTVSGSGRRILPKIMMARAGKLKPSRRGAGGSGLFHSRICSPVRGSKRLTIASRCSVRRTTWLNELSEE